MTTAAVDALLAARLPVIMEIKRRTGEGEELMGERTIPELVTRVHRRRSTLHLGRHPAAGSAETTRCCAMSPS